MPCPFFEPKTVASFSEYPGARLPLLEEYDGICHAESEPIPAPGELRFRCCNHGYSRGTCPHLPKAETRSAMRFDVIARTPEILEFRLVEESEYTPLRWHTLRYSIAGGVIEPLLEDICMLAQAHAFCRSFLSRFSC